MKGLLIIRNSNRLYNGPTIHHSNQYVTLQKNIKIKIIIVGKISSSPQIKKFAVQRGGAATMYNRESWYRMRAGIVVSWYRMSLQRSD